MAGSGSGASEHPPRALEFCVLVLLACLAGFVSLIVAAMWLYPGGNWLDRGVAGHRFFANFLCDLTQPISLSGVDNSASAGCAKVAMLLFAGALASFFWVLPRLVRFEARLAHSVRWLGEGAAILCIAVPLSPSERCGSFHAGLSLVAGGLGLSATVCALLGLALSGGPARRLVPLGALATLAALADGVLFVYHWGDATPPPLIVPATQKVAAVLFCCWMAMVAWRALALSRASVSRHP